MHYAAALQGTTGGHNTLYTLLVEAGASEDVVDVVGQRFFIQIFIALAGYSIHHLPVSLPITRGGVVV